MSRPIIWSPRSKHEYLRLLQYLFDDWGHGSVKKFNTRLIEALRLISENPEIYQVVNKKNKVRRCVVSKQTSLFYRVKKNEIELITLFDTRQQPSKKNLK